MMVEIGIKNQMNAEFENAMFTEIASALRQLRDSTGAQRDWFDLDLDPATRAAVARLEERITSDEVVLETLLRAQGRLEQECGAD